MSSTFNSLHLGLNLLSILTLNAGSSSIKAGLFSLGGSGGSPGDDPGDDPGDGSGGGGGGHPLQTVVIEQIGGKEPRAIFRCRDGQTIETRLDGNLGESHQAAVAWLITALQDRLETPLMAIGHRIVHGGTHYSAPTLVTPGVIAKLEDLIPLARTHQPYGLAGIEAAENALPGLPQIACFDTAFHQTIPDRRQHLPLPQSITGQGVRKYGFHGLSYEWISARLPDEMGERAEGHVVVAHLGNGASLCGMKERKSEATTMGFTPLDGLMMGERPGQLDPGVVLFLFEELGLSVAEVRHILFKESGLKGVSGLSNDLRVLEAADTETARLAIAIYVHRIAREIAAIATEIGGLDALVFTAGVGENAVGVRRQICDKLSWLGVQIDDDVNKVGKGCITSPSSRIAAYVIPTNEEAVIARETKRLATLNPG